ncbi:hypothetical protein SUGI_1181390 [Cryptomeria japonica]|nr:hypothetical protein SUGI_1181390 [Cryptomeria japonica]
MTVKELFTNLSSEALRSPNLYSNGIATFTSYTIYSMFECWIGSTLVEDCKTCLTNATSELLSVTLADNGPFQGGGIGSGSCYARYETYPFFNSATPSPSFLQPLSPKPVKQQPLPPRTLSNMLMKFLLS